MNIKKAKEQIKNAIIAYSTKDELGNYIIPIEKQRPILLIGAPGIGKTAIMEQIAAELGVGLLSYSMTHHTRQSAIGLPSISHKNYKGQEYDITEYTMSEIIASMYELMENSRIEEGILFLDEINCVSETLTPLMLQFLQYKVFGKHRIPEGWVIVTAGNPPEYNDAVREFDVATLDRLKKITVEPDYEVWKEYAYKAGVHPAITSFLDAKKASFYSVETTIDGKSFVTPRGWEDLSKMLQLYEVHGLPADEDLIIQYVQNSKTAKEFAVYYDLFEKYKSDYQVNQILEGRTDDSIITRANNAGFDERYSLIGLLLDAANQEIRTVIEEESIIRASLADIKRFRSISERRQKKPGDCLAQVIHEEEVEFQSKVAAGSISTDDKHVKQKTILYLNELMSQINGTDDPKAAFQVLRKDFNGRTKGLSDKAESTKGKLSNLFRFAEKAFGTGQEMVIIVTELTANYYSAKFISTYGCKEYFEHNKELLFYERQKEIIADISKLEEL